MVRVDWKTDDFEDFSKSAIRDALVGRIATCSECAGQRIVVSSISPEDADMRTVWTVACGEGCTHNISGFSLAEIVNKWNKELVDEGEEDFATEVVVYLM